MERIEEIFRRAGVRPSPVRILIARMLAEATAPVSALDIETALTTVDRSSISRTLSLFAETRMVHTVHDGTGAVKYELCSSPEGSHAAHAHVHFHCRACGVTECLSSMPVPKVELPDGYEADEAGYMLTGLCARCSRSGKGQH